MGPNSATFGATVDGRKKGKPDCLLLLGIRPPKSKDIRASSESMTESETKSRTTFL